MHHFANLLAIALGAGVSNQQPAFPGEKDGLFAQLMGGYHWTEPDNASRVKPLIQSAMRRLSRLPKDQLRAEVLTYLSISRIAPDGTDRNHKLLARAYDVGVLNRLVFTAELPSIKDKWFGPVGMYQNTPPWKRTGRNAELVMAFGLVTSGAGFDALGEFDELHAAFKKRKGRG